MCTFRSPPWMEKCAMVCMAYSPKNEMRDDACASAARSTGGLSFPRLLWWLSGGGQFVCLVALVAGLSTFGNPCCWPCRQSTSLRGSWLLMELLCVVDVPCWFLVAPVFWALLILMARGFLQAWLGSGSCRLAACSAVFSRAPAKCECDLEACTWRLATGMWVYASSAASD